jgi:hypothetical protein
MIAIDEYLDKTAYLSRPETEGVKKPANCGFKFKR